MECLRDYIGIFGCGNAAPESGLFINSLPGISLESIDKLSKPEQATYYKVWQDVQTRGLQSFEGNVTIEFAKRFRKKSVKQSINLGKKIDLINEQSAAIDQYRGAAAEANFKNEDPFTVSNLQGVSFQSLSLYLKAVPANPITVGIWDMDTKDLLFTTVVNNAANPVSIGWNNITVNRIFYGVFRIFFAYDAKEIGSPLLNLNSSYLSTLYGGCASLMWGCSCEGNIRGAQTTTKTDPSELAYGNNGFGLTATFSVVCTFQPLVCNNKRLFDDTLWYTLGAEMMIERLYSPRWNWWTLEKDEAKDMLRYFQQMAAQNMELAIGGIDLDQSDGCIQCNNHVMIMEQTP